MSPTYNRGEWAELYVLVKILCEKSVTVKVHGTGGTGQALEVLRIRRGSDEDLEEFLVEGDHIACVHAGTNIPTHDVCSRVNSLFDAIKVGKGHSFPLTIGDELLALLAITQLKINSREKSDIYLDVRDPLTGVTGSQGYTIKALIGSTPTLFNASQPTNFEYRIDPQIPDALVAEYNSTDSEGKLVHGTREMVSDLLAEGYVFTLVSLDERFRENLELLDGNMPKFLDELVLAYYGRLAGTATSVSELLESLEESNPLGLSNPNIRYRHKVKDFLEASAYGMVPTEPYRGERTAAGGLLLVEKNGELTCFRLDDKDRTRDYLIEHAYLDTASRSRHKFGILDNRDGHTYIKLNLQVRYK